MSRWSGGPRGSADDLAYGDFPQRWDRDRFERVGGGGGREPPRRYEEDYRFVERDTPRRTDVAVTDRIESRGPRGRYDERDRFVEEVRRTPSRPRRRTDRELFGDVDPREIADMAMTPYRQAAPPRPGLLRRQSSLDTFDRRPIPRYEREERRIPVYTEVPVPVPARRGRRYEEDFEEVRERDYEPEDYREVEITRERSVRRRPKSTARSSKAKSVTTRRESSSSSSSSGTVEKATTKAPSVHESIHESLHENKHGRSTSVHESFHESVHGGTAAPSMHESVHESFHAGPASVRESVSASIQETTKKFKKGKTRMPKRLVRREAIMDLGYPFDEEEDFFVLRIALEKEQIDEVIAVSETYKNGEKKTMYRYEEKLDEAPDPPAPAGDHEEVIRTEWINPPTVIGSRSRSVARSARTARRSSSGSPEAPPRAPAPPAEEEFYEERKTVVEERSRSRAPSSSHHGGGGGGGGVFEERETIIEERSPSHIRSPSHGGALVIADREQLTDREIKARIRALEAERRALRLERDAEEKRGLAVRLRGHAEDEYQVVEYREPSHHHHHHHHRNRSRDREVLEIVERERSPARNVLRVEKDRKERTNAKIRAAALATLT